MLSVFAERALSHYIVGNTMIPVMLLFSCSIVSDSVTSWTVARQAPLSMGFPRQKYWSGVPLPSPLVQDFNIKCLITLHLGLSPSLPLLKEISQVFRHHPYKKLI